MARQSGLMLACVVALVAPGCSGSGNPSSTVSVPDVEFGTASNTDGLLRPTPNGFSFANFAANSVPAEDFGGADLAAMFGSGPEVCASGADSTCSPTAEADEWARMVNESRQSGHCEGFIVQALLRFGTKETPDTSSLTNSPSVVHGIMRGFASQFLSETRAESKAWSKRSVRDITAELVSSLKDGIPDYVLGVYGEIGGHAVLPYSVTFTDADHASIGIYDSNWPGQERHITVDLAAQEWVFSFDGADPETDPNAWTGGNGSMDLSSLNAHVRGPCPFCDSKTTTTTPTMLAIRASTPSWTLTTSHGIVSADSQGTDGVHVSKVRAAESIPSKVNEWVVSVDPAEFASNQALTLRLPANSTSTIITPRAIARAGTSKTATADFSIKERSITTASRSATLVLANGNKKVSATNKAATLTLDSSDAPVVGSSNVTTVPQTATTKPSSTTTTTVGTTVVQATTTTSQSPAPTTSTTATTAVPVTTAPATTVAPPTTVNQRPNVTATACTGSASTVTLTLSVSDNENDAITGPTFAFVSGPTNSMTWSSPSSTAPYKWTGVISTPYAPIVLDITVSDAGGSRTVRKTLTSSNNQWNGAGTCSVA